MCSCFLFLPLPQSDATNSSPQEPRGSGYGIPWQLFGENMVIGGLAVCPLPNSCRMTECRGWAKGRRPPPLLTVSMWPTSCGVEGRWRETYGRAEYRSVEADQTVVLGAQGSLCPFHNHSGEEGVSTPLAQSLGLLFPAPY